MLTAAILLGHLKLSLSDIRQALYLLDETVLTPELLKQLLTYAPNKNEVMFCSFFLKINIIESVT